MKAGSILLITVFVLPGLVACQSPKEPKQPTQPTKTKEPGVITSSRHGPWVIASSRRHDGIGAVPTGEPGVYRVNAALEGVTGVRVVPKTSKDDADGRLVDASRWNFDRSTWLVHVDEPVDDARESVIVLGTRVRPPEVMLPEHADFSSVRVVVGDRLGVEGNDYTLDPRSGRLKLLGPDTPESPMRYYVQVALKPDPAHPEMGQTLAFGNHGDQATIRRVLGMEPR